ncbi:MAG: hypothetical protein MJY87_06420 [Fibrobacter sp.]|nr:hypothetical protein [Fibrobacter sp.]
MNHKILYLLIAFLASNSFATKYIAVLETVSLGDVIMSQEKRYLTDKLREVATRAFSSSTDFTIMTSENIEVMLPPGKSIEDCEGSCIVETGKNISADYVAQGRIGSFDGQLTLAVELYETASGKLIGSFVERKNSVREIAEEVEQNVIYLFCKIQQDSQNGNCTEENDSSNDYTGDHTPDFWIVRKNEKNRQEENSFEDDYSSNRLQADYDIEDSGSKAGSETTNEAEMNSRNPISFDFRLMLDMAAGFTSYSAAPLYGTAVESQFGPGFKFGIGFEVEHSVSRQFLFGIVTAFNAYYEYVDFSIQLPYTDSFLNSYYTNTSDYGYEYSSWFFRLDLSAMIAFGNGFWYIFFRPAVSIGLGNKISFQKNADDISWKEPDYRPSSAATNVTTCVGMIDFGFRLYESHELYVQISPPLFNGDYIEKIDYTIYLGYRWSPALKTNLFSL